MLVLESRRLGGLLVILISILLLSFSAPKTLHLSPTVSQNHPSDTAISRLYRPHVKRDQELRDRFGSLVCKGRKYFVKGVSQASRMGINQGPDFGQDAFRDNGWTVSIPRNNVPPTWAPVFENIPPRVPNRDEASFVKLEQDKAFTNNWRQNNEPTGGEYNGFYIPFSNIILMTITYSPRYWVQGLGISDNEVNQRIPFLNTVSDVVWEAWTRIAQQPGNLRFYAIHNIMNSIATQLMDYLFEKHRPGFTNVEWNQRLVFGIDSDEGRALFATPNGIAVAWILINHQGALGSRVPRVSIFRVGGLNCMIWEMIPVGGRSTFDDYTATNMPN